MIRSLRRRFIFGAVLSLTILIALLIGGISLVGYIQMEQGGENFLRVLLEGPVPMPVPPPPMQDTQFAFGYSFEAQSMPAGYCLLNVDSTGQLVGIDVNNLRGMDTSNLQPYIDEILSGGEDHGKAGVYKYRLERDADGLIRIALLDNSIQATLLAGTLRTGLLLGFLAIVAMFIILLPISKQLMRNYAAHIEKQKQFITNASHELKTPIAIIQSNIDAMELIQGENKWSRNIRGQTVRLNTLLLQLIFMARIDEQPFSSEKADISLGALLKEEAAAYEEILRKRSVSLTANIKDELVVCGSQENLKQLIHILMDNAAQYTNAEGEINIVTEKQKRFARLIVRNTVSNLPDCPPENLFDRFYRGDAARTQKTSGCGVGLSAALAIVQMHRGKIEAQYIGDHTIQFVVDLPLSR